MRIQLTDVEDPPDLARLGRTGALAHAKQCALLAAVRMGRLGRIEQEIDGADRVRHSTRPRVRAALHQRRGPLARESRRQLSRERGVLLGQVCSTDRVGDADDGVKARLDTVRDR